MAENAKFKNLVALCRLGLQEIYKTEALKKMNLLQFYNWKKSSLKNYIICDGISLFDCAKTEFVCIKFNDTKFLEKDVEELMKFAQKEASDIVYCDSFFNGKEHLKTDFSIELALKGNEEYDVLLIRYEILYMIQNLFEKRFLKSSNDLLVAASFITKKIHHYNKCMYSTMQKEGKHSSLRQFYLDDMELVNNKKVSIIIPTKDKMELLQNCLTSIIDNSSYKNYEIIIVNNRSEEKETYNYFESVSKNGVIVVDADIDFNWSKLNNIGIKNSSGDIFVFLNNDTEVINVKWLDEIVSDCSRKDVGIVGGLLMYEDSTIQHAGVVVGLTDFADHLYKGEKCENVNDCFYSPLVKRNVLAVTGACMAVSRYAIEQIGLFNEEFIICGSDVEMCIRSYSCGFNNIYNPQIKLYHLESKSRDSYIPPIDFEMSKKHYEPYRTKGDPFFNISLDKKKTTPTLKR